MLFVGLSLLVFVLLLAGAVLALVMPLVAALAGPVERKRVERFALRQAIRITTANGAVVVRYLATTRRWRGGLLALTLIGSVLVTFAIHRRLDFSGVAGFGGWFVGAVVAEWRVDALARGPRAAASLYRRRAADYVARGVLVLAVVLWLCVAVLAVGDVVAALVRSSGLFAAIADLVAAVAAGTAILLVVRRVLTRPQPLAAEDLLEADNAIRGRSLKVLAGAALAIGGYLGAAALGALILDAESASVQLVRLVGFAALPILGVLVAVRPRLDPVLRSVPTPA